MIGLGDIWRFPYVAYDNGGGAFLVPYLVALLTAGIPLLIMEFSLGHRSRGSAPPAFRSVHRAATGIGWWQVAICFVIATYYAVIIAWAVRYLGFSVSLQWGGDPESFLYGDFLQVGDAPGGISSYVTGVMWPLIGIWVITLGILALGVRKGIERANKIFVPMLLVLFSIIVVRALFLEGAGVGLEALFKPDWGAILNADVWLAAYIQVFFSLSVGFGIMTTYASYLRRKSDLTGSAMVAAFTNSSFEILAGIGVFAALGFISVSNGVPVRYTADQGIGLAFVAFPKIISTLPAGAHLFGVAFFVSLIVAGLTSLISIVQVVVAAVQERTGLRRGPAVLAVGGAVALASVLIFPTDQGLYYLDVVDHFINQYGIALAALASIIAVGWWRRQLPALRDHANLSSAMRVGPTWMILLGYATPLALAWLSVESAISELSTPYGDYPVGFLVAVGWLVAACALLAGVVLGLLPWRRQEEPGVITIEFQKGRRQ